MASILADPDLAQHKPPYVVPAEIYYGSCPRTSPIKLEIATGGAGQSGLVRALADAFIGDHIERTGCEPFAVSWLKSDTSASFNYLAQGSADLSITYHHAAEQIARQQGVAERYEYAWRDHFMLVGKTLNPREVLQKEVAWSKRSRDEAVMIEVTSSCVEKLTSNPCED